MKERRYCKCWPCIRSSRDGSSIAVNCRRVGVNLVRASINTAFLFETQEQVLVPFRSSEWMVVLSASVQNFKKSLVVL